MSEPNSQGGLFDGRRSQTLYYLAGIQSGANMLERREVATECRMTHRARPCGREVFLFSAMILTIGAASLSACFFLSLQVAHHVSAKHTDARHDPSDLCRCS